MDSESTKMKPYELLLKYEKLEMINGEMFQVVSNSSRAINISFCNKELNKCM